jgi:hypothetical protein
VRNLAGILPDVEIAVISPLIAEIEALKKERNAVVLAHNYMTPDIFHGVADLRGDSLALARMAEETPAPELPDRLSLDPRSPHFNEDVLKAGVGIRFNGQEKTNVEEYCVSEGWIRVSAGRSRDRHGNPMTLKLKGKVEPYVEPKHGFS